MYYVEWDALPAIGVVEVIRRVWEKYEDSVSVLGLLRLRSDLKSIFFLP